jgi:hypothetical protein
LSTALPAQAGEAITNIATTIPTSLMA